MRKNKISAISIVIGYISMLILMLLISGLALYYNDILPNRITSVFAIIISVFGIIQIKPLVRDLWRNN